jgi:hypothetical protein
LPDKINQGEKKSQEEADNENEEFINAAHMAFNSPNPNFIVLDRELLENFNQENEFLNQEQSAEESQEKTSVQESKTEESTETSTENKQEKLPAESEA